MFGSQENTLWVEKFRPGTLDGYVGNEHIIEKVKLYLKSGDVPHLLFYGGAGTGKTVAAMHRARWLAENRLSRPTDRILFTTFTSNLAADIQENLRAICETDQLQRIEVVHLDAWVSSFLKSHGESRSIVFPGSNEKLDGFWAEAVTNYGSETGLETKFFQDECC